MKPTPKTFLKVCTLSMALASSTALIVWLAVPDAAYAEGKGNGNGNGGGNGMGNGGGNGNGAGNGNGGGSGGGGSSGGGSSGGGGGQVIATGTPETLASEHSTTGSHTGRFLRRVLPADGAPAAPPPDAPAAPARPVAKARSARATTKRAASR